MKKLLFILSVVITINCNSQSVPTKTVYGNTRLAKGVTQKSSSKPHSAYYLHDLKDTVYILTYSRLESQVGEDRLWNNMYHKVFDTEKEAKEYIIYIKEDKKCSNFKIYKSFITYTNELL